MTVLVAGNAALLDLLLSADRIPSNSEVAFLTGGPGASGVWLPGGAALAIAGIIAESGKSVRLWHPLPSDRSVPLGLLTDRRVDLEFCPTIAVGVPRCIILDSPEGRQAWSTPGEDILPTAIEALLEGVTHIVFAPVWGNWANVIAKAAVERAIPMSLVGEALPETLQYSWNIVVLDEGQASAVPGLSAEILATTLGSKGAALRQGRCNYRHRCHHYESRQYDRRRGYVRRHFYRPHPQWRPTHRCGEARDCVRSHRV